MRRALVAAASLLLVVAAAGVFGAWWVDDRYRRPGPLTDDMTLVIPRGAGVAMIAARLSDAGVVSDPWVFRLGARWEDADKALRAGEYRFPAGTSAKDVIDRLRAGDTVVRRITIPEGLSSAEIVALVARADGLVGETGPTPGEGTLLPETYHFDFGTPRQEILARMMTAMRETVDDLWTSRAEGLPLTSSAEAVILASIVEEETALAEERPRVAAVFLNRMRAGMRLQSDPTVAYALTGGGPLGRPLTRADWTVDSPFNTYVIDGLPPAPISNPGRAALAAVLNPADTDEKYFVADGTGGHAFARTLREHNRNVARWRQLRRKMAQ